MEHQQLVRDSTRRTLQAWGAACLAGVGYLALGYLSKLASCNDQGATGLWFPTGFLLGVALIAQREHIGKHALFCAIAHLIFLVNQGVSLPAAIGLVAGGQFTALGGAWLIRRFGSSDPPLSTLKQCSILFFPAAIGVSAFGAAIGSASLFANGDTAGFLYRWIALWGADAAGIAVAAPMVVGMEKMLAGLIRWPSGMELAERAIVMTAVVGCGLFMRGSGGTTGTGAYIVLPFLIWAVVRFRTSGASLLVALFAFVSGTISHLELPASVSELPNSMHDLPLVALLLIVAGTSQMLFSYLREHQESSDKTAEENLRLRALLEDLPEGLATIAPNGVLAAANSTAARILGFSDPESLVAGNVNVLDVIAPEDRNRAQAGIEQSGRSGRLQTTRFTAMRRDGVRVPIELSLSSTSALGRSPTSLAILRDISHRKRVEEEERKAVDLLRAVVNASPAAIVTMDPRGVVRMWNPAAEAIFGWTANEVLGRVMPAMVSDKRSEFASAMTRALAGESVRAVESRRRRKNGAPVDVSMSSAPLFGPDGSVTAIMAILEDITDRKHIQAAERRVTESLHAIVNSVPVGIVMLDPHGIVQAWNPAATRIFGWSEDDVRGKYLPTVPPDAHEDFAELRRRVLQGESFVNRQIRRKRKDGQSVDVLMSLAPMYAVGQLPVGIVAVYEDITERIDVEQLLKLAVEATASGLWDWRIPTGEIRLEPTWLTLMGHGTSAESMPHSEWVETLHPEDAKRVETAMAKHLAGGAPSFESEHRRRTASGDWMWVLERGRVVETDDHGRPTRVVGTMIDIGEKRASASEIQSHLNTLQALYRGVKNVMLATNLPEMAEDIVSSCVELLGATAAWIGIAQPDGTVSCLSRAPKGASEFDSLQVRWDDTPLGQGPTGTAIRTSQTITMPNFFATAAAAPWSDIATLAGGVSFPLLLQGKPYGCLTAYCSDSGFLNARKVETMKVFADLASAAIERLQLHEELNQQAALLELRVRERTAQLEAANQDIESFSYSVSHDLRAPLRHISGYANMLSKSEAGSLSEESKGFIESINLAAHRMGGLIDALLNLSRIGRTETHMREVDLTALVEEVVAEFADDMKGRQIEIEVGKLGAVLGDRRLLRSAFANLLDNALKFTRTKEIASIRLVPSERDSDPEFIAVRVEDNGAGFNMAYADKLFGVFQRLHSDREFEGTGVGLATVHRIIRRHGGTIAAEAAPNEGARFTIKLPRYR